MQVDAKPSSPSKGKAREDSNWQVGWWELHPSFERVRRCVLIRTTAIISEFLLLYRPVVWSKSSVIFSAHASKPLVLARHFSSSREFILPSPITVNEHPTAYEPPTVISLCPNDTWLFASFPGIDRDGVACLWQRRYQLDSFVVREFWNTPVGAGIVAAQWTNSDREVTRGLSCGIAHNTEASFTVDVERYRPTISASCQGSRTPNAQPRSNSNNTSAPSQRLFFATISTRSQDIKGALEPTHTGS